MRVALTRIPATPDGERYLRRPTTSGREGPGDGVLDTYCELVPLRQGEVASAAFERVYQRLCRYDIFPPTLVGSRIFPDGGITDGCTIVQRLGVGWMFLESATRVVDIWDMVDGYGSRRAGFAYVTVQGHPERGVATFEVHKVGDVVSVVLTAHSTPGTALTRLARPVTRMVQRAVTRRAVWRLVGRC